MQAGKLRHRITIQKRPDTKDAAGQRSGPWEDVFTNVPATVQDLSGRELANAPAEVTVTVSVRGFAGWRSQIKPDMRALSGDRLFDIKGIVNPDSRDRELLLLCMELVS